MEVFIALYRGINVGGRNVVKMESLRAMHRRLGGQGVQSYVQGGNIVFWADGPPDLIAEKLAARFVKEFKFAAKVLVVHGRRWDAIVKANPYAKVAAANPRAVHVGICDSRPSASALELLLTRTGGTESFEVREKVVYLHAPDGLGTSKFAAGIEKACGVPMTLRNWRTVEALRQMAGASNLRRCRS